MANFIYRPNRLSSTNSTPSLKEIFKGYGFDEEAYKKKQSLKGGETHEQSKTTRDIRNKGL